MVTFKEIRFILFFTSFGVIRSLQLDVKSPPQSIQCGNLSCSPTADCIEGDNGLKKCMCLIGFTGVTCSEDIDECSSGHRTCFYRGFCNNAKGTFSCQCLQGWSGSHCEQPILPPESRKCVPGHMGDLCRDTCLDNSTCGETQICKQHGQPPRLDCICKPGWHGVSCTEDVDECHTHPCGINFTCINTSGSFLCSNITESEDISSLPPRTENSPILWIVIGAVLGLLLVGGVILITVCASKKKCSGSTQINPTGHRVFDGKIWNE